MGFEGRAERHSLRHNQEDILQQRHSHEGSTGGGRGGGEGGLEGVRGKEVMRAYWSISVLDPCRKPSLATKRWRKREVTGCGKEQGEMKVSPLPLPACLLTEAKGQS